jgi:tRNA (guanine-N7-)-methyltransferase
VEIGFGNGEFLAELARERPHWNLVGFEVALTCLKKAGTRLAQAGVENVRLARVDGKFALRELFPAESVEEVYLNFPCPWPKARHAPRRLVDREFVRILAGVLAPRGKFFLTTDVDWYAQNAAQVLREDGGFSLRGPRPLGEGGPGTRYERKWRREGRPIFRLEAEKVAGREHVRIAEGEMPHVKLTQQVRKEEVEALVGLKESWPGGAFVVKGAYWNPAGEEGLLRVFATDQGFQQQYFLAVVRGAGGWMVKLDGATVPFRTPAVKRSVVQVAAVLEGRKP